MNTDIPLLNHLQAQWHNMLSNEHIPEQLGLAVLALLGAWLLALLLRHKIGAMLLSQGAGKLAELPEKLKRTGQLLTPLMVVIGLSVAVQLALDLLGHNWMLRGFQGLAVVYLLHRFVTVFVPSPVFRLIVNWVFVPLAILHITGQLTPVMNYLDGVALPLGDLRVSLLAISRALLFGFLLFWLGRISNSTGKRVIRNQEQFDLGTREVLAKLFEITLFAVIFLLLLQIMGINLTALAVFGGALGVGLGFGLQQIAANFVSGIIILLDRSITIGDYVELEDGRGGRIRELSMRSATLETFDGKDIMVPNERFITTAFTNWTHHNKKQRYPIEFSVAYDTDLELLFKVVRDVVASHPKVLSGDDVPIAERPDAEIAAFEDSGIKILVEFWMNDIDDGENRVGADLLLMIWTTLREHNIVIPFPQQEVRFLHDKD